MSRANTPPMATTLLSRVLSEKGLIHCGEYDNFLDLMLVAPVKKPGERRASAVYVTFSVPHWRITSPDALPSIDTESGLHRMIFPIQNGENITKAVARVKSTLFKSLDLVANFPEWRSANWNTRTMS
jgi:hypothetical protein